MLNRSLLFLGLIVASASMGFAATNSNTATVALSATVGSSITINPIGGVSFGTVAPAGTYAGSSQAVVQMYWNLAPSYSALNLYAYFTDPAAALTDAQPTPSNIPSSAVKIKATTSTGSNNIPSFTAVTGTNPGFGAAGASLLVKSVTINGTNKTVPSTSPDTTTLDLQLDLTAISSLAAGSYNGTLNIQAQATP